MIIYSCISCGKMKETGLLCDRDGLVAPKSAPGWYITTVPAPGCLSQHSECDYKAIGCYPINACLGNNICNTGIYIYICLGYNICDNSYIYIYIYNIGYTGVRCMKCSSNYIAIDGT